jgi:hypothetical protein
MKRAVFVILAFILASIGVIAQPSIVGADPTPNVYIQITDCYYGFTPVEHFPAGYIEWITNWDHVGVNTYIFHVVSTDGVIVGDGLTIAPYTGNTENKVVHRHSESLDAAYQAGWSALIVEGSYYQVGVELIDQYGVTIGTWWTEPVLCVPGP